MTIKRKLAELAEIRPGYLARAGVEPTEKGTHRLLQIRDFNSDRSAIDPTALIRFIPDSVSSLQPLKAGEVVFLARGSKNFAHALPALPSPALAASYFFVIHPRKEVLPAYLAWFLNQPTTLRALSRVATSGAHMPVLRRAEIENIEVPVPLIAAQLAIIELDKLMRQEQTLLKELARRKHDLISTVCMTAAQSGKKTGESHD